jgi:hypothetical protein
MNARRSQIYLAHALPSEEVQDFADGDDDCVLDLRPEEAAEYIASLLATLRPLAVQAHFRLLSDLISVAEEEARFLCRP